MSKRVAFVFINLLVLILPLSLQAQKPAEAARDTSNFPYWIEMMQDPNANFHTTVRAFNQYWEDRKVTKGSGWKPFKRWESFMQSRIKEDGSKPAPDEVWNEYWKTQNQKNKQKSSSASSANWTEMGPIQLPTNGTGQPNGMGRVNGIGFHPTNANIFYVGAPQGGVWKTTDAGLTWSSTTDDLPTLGVSSILVDYDTPNTIYIGTGDRDAGDAPGLGVMKSTDGGATWNSSNTGMGNRTVGMMVMHPTDSDIILAATSSGIYKTIDGAANWTLEQSGNFKDIEYKPNDASIAYASASGNFYRSTDGGDSWTSLGTSEGIPSAYRMVIGVTPDNSNVVYVLASNSGSFKALYKSMDSGASFTTQSTTPNIMDWSTNGSGTSGQAWYDLCIAVDPNDETIVYTGGINVFKSTNSGVNWTVNTHWYGAGGNPSVHADQHALEFSPVNDNLYLTNDGGLYFTSNDGDTWTDRSSGLGIAQVYKIGQSATVKDLVINGYQDNGTAIYDGAWRTEIGGDGMECVIDHTNSNYQYGALYYGNIRRSTNNGISFSVIAEEGSNGITEGGAWVTPYTLHETDANTMFVGYKNIWRSTNVKAVSSGSVTWTKITNLSSNTNTKVIEHSPVNTNLLYFVRDDNTFYRIDNVMAVSPTVVNLTSNLPVTAEPTDIEAHPTDENIVYITLSNNVYKSTDKGVSWTDISVNIPNINTNCLVYEIGSNEALYVGTDAGIYYKNDCMIDWILFAEGLPVNAEITELEIYYDDDLSSESRIRASTYGRGLWESPLESTTSAEPLTDFRVPITQICLGESIVLEDLSSCSPENYQWTFSPNSVTYLNNTSSTSPNPEVQFDATTTYSITLTVSNSFGSNSKTLNDYISVTNSVNLPLSLDFESVSNCNTGSDCGNTNCNLNLNNSWYNETNGIGDNIDWRADDGGTPSSDTGPNTDHTTGNGTGMYLYLEASNGCTQQSAHLVSPCLSIPSGTTEFRFWYHAYGADMGSLHIDLFQNGEWTQDISSAISGNQGNVWLEKIVDLSSYEGQIVKLRIRGITGNNWLSDLAIDDLTIQNTPTNNIITSFTATPTQGCEGTTVNYTDTSTGSPTAWSWTFAGGTPASSNLQNPTVTYHNAGTFTASLTASNVNGSNTLVKQSHIHISAPPTASIDGDLEICEGESTTLTASGGNTYFWNTDESGNQITVSPSQNTTYTVTAIDGNGCTDSHQVTVVVHSNPIASIDGDLEICEGESTTLTASGGNTYFWNTDESGNQITVSPSQNTTYTVTAIDGNGCTDTHQVTVVVTTSLVADISGDLEICNGESTTLTASGGNTYNWDTGATGNQITVNPVENTNYIVTAISGNCSDSHQVTVVVHSNPTASIDGDLEICEGESTTLTATGGSTYTWDTDESGNQITVSPSQNTTYTVTAIDGNGCTDTHQVTVVVHSNPIASIEGNLDICENESTTLTASGGNTYLWNTGSESSSIAVSPTENTVYSVVVTDANGCQDTHQVTVNVGTGENCCETVVFIEYENTTDLPPCVSADDYIKAGNYGAGNTVISNTQNVQFSAGNYINLDPGFTVEEGGVLNTEITGAAPSSPFANQTATLKTAIEKSTVSNNETQLLLSPNPFTIATTANYYLYEEAVVSLSVYDLSGKKVEQLIHQQAQTVGSYKVSFESCNLKEGVYICVLEMDGVQKVSKLLKQ